MRLLFISLAILTFSITLQILPGAFPDRSLASDLSRQYPIEYKVKLVENLRGQISASSDEYCDNPIFLTYYNGFSRIVPGYLNGKRQDLAELIGDARTTDLIQTDVLTDELINLLELAANVNTESYLACQHLLEIQQGTR